MATTASRKAVLAIICGSFIHHIQLASAHAEREAAQTASSFVRKRWESGGEIKHFRDRQLATCEQVRVTGGLDGFPGLYNPQGQGTYISADGSSRLFYTEDTSRRRARRATEDITGAAAAVIGGEEEETGEEQHGGLPRRLGACSSGFWSLGPTGDGYPRLTVGDCAVHPADIKVTEWMQVTCADCDGQTFNGAAPTVACAEDGSSSSSTSPNKGTGDDDDDGNVESTPPPGAADDDSGGSSGGSDGGPVAGTDGCEVLDVAGRYSGLYTRVGTYNEKGDYYTADMAHNIFFEIEAPTVTGGGDGDDDNDDDNRRNMRRALSEAGLPQRRGTRDLAACDTGYWIKTPTGGGYPFFAVADCANNPENISASSSWLIVTCANCEASQPQGTQSVACATGADAIISTPAPVPAVEFGFAIEEDLPGTVVSTCTEVTIEGSRGGVYSVIGEKNSLPELLRSDEQFRMYFTAPAPALQTNSQRGLSLAGKGDGNEDEHLAEISQRRGLSSCDNYWYILPANGLKYPTFAVADCALHPADITSTDWLYIECESCPVVIVETGKPDVFCTGERTYGKRNGAVSTPAPTPAGKAVTPAPISSAESTCTELAVTGDFAGNYSMDGTYRGKMDFFSDTGEYNLYFETVESRRALREDVDTQGKKRLLPGDVMTDALEEAHQQASRSLAVCTSGFWILAPVAGDSYPVFGVPDCAEHPADIRANTWLTTSCATCTAKEAPSFVAPGIECSGNSRSIAISSDSSTTPAPAFPANCGIVYVYGPTAGAYGQRGEQAGRPDFFSGNRMWNLYWAFYAGKPENRNRNRRGLSLNKEGWSEEHERALHTLASDVNGGRGTAVEPEDVELTLEVEGRDLTAEQLQEARRRRLEFCDSGFWLITPRGGGFPFYGTQNCADHPADMPSSTPWSVVECDGCGSVPLNDTISFSCDGEGYTPPPSPVANITAPDGTPVSPSPVGSEPGELEESSQNDAAGVGVCGGFLVPLGGYVVTAVVASALAGSVL